MERGSSKGHAQESGGRRSKARERERLALAHGKKPVKSLKDLARGTPEDADELLEAIRELREDEE